MPFGDYGVASNHVLPTAGTARFSSGLRAADYVTVTLGRARWTRGAARPVRARHLGDRERRGPGRSRPRHGRPRRRDRSGGTVTPAAEPRPGVRDVEPYVSPQLDVAARLNTNECPHPLPDGFSDELAAAVRDLPLNRYPDGQMTRAARGARRHHGHPLEGTWTANGSNEVLTELLLAYGGPGQTRRRVRAHVPAALAPRRGSPTPRSSQLDSPDAVRARRRDVDERAGGRDPTSCSSARRTTRPATRSRVEAVALARRAHRRRWSSSTRPTSSSAARAR